MVAYWLVPGTPDQMSGFQFMLMPGCVLEPDTFTPYGTKGWL